MAGPGGSGDVVARDDAHLRSLGIKPELRRSLGFLSVFAVAFSYISVSTGTFTNQALPAWPIFETLVIATIVIGTVYYLLFQRGKLDRVQVEADVATGEAVIG